MLRSLFRLHGSRSFGLKQDTRAIRHVSSEDGQRRTMGRSKASMRQHRRDEEQTRGRSQQRETMHSSDAGKKAEAGIPLKEGSFLHLPDEETLVCLTPPELMSAIRSAVETGFLPRSSWMDAFVCCTSGPRGNTLKGFPIKDYLAVLDLMVVSSQVRMDCDL